MQTRGSDVGRDNAGWSTPGLKACLCKWRCAGGGKEEWGSEITARSGAFVLRKRLPIVSVIGYFLAFLSEAVHAVGPRRIASRVGQEASDLWLEDAISACVHV